MPAAEIDKLPTWSNNIECWIYAPDEQKFGDNVQKTESALK
jgi:hypothetical protein